MPHILFPFASRQDASLLKNTGDETTARVAEIFELLNQRLGEPDSGASMCFFECIINPRSYAQTIENMFHLSFLVRGTRGSKHMREPLTKSAPL